MQDYFIKTEDEATLKAILILADVAVLTPESTQTTPEFTEEDGTVVPEQSFVFPEVFSAKEGYALDIIGTISKPTGNVIEGEDGISYPEMTQVAGYHANLRGTLSEEQLTILADVLIDAPANPARVWA